MRLVLLDQWLMQIRDSVTSDEYSALRDRYLRRGDFFLVCVTGRFAQSLEYGSIKGWANMIKREKDTERLDAFLVVRLCWLTELLTYFPLSL